MIDYKTMYFILYKSIGDIIDILYKAQQQTEALFAEGQDEPENKNGHFNL